MTRVVVFSGCFFGIWSSWLLARADFLYQQDTEDSLRAAIRLVPDGWRYYMRLAQFDQSHALELLNQALRRNRYNSQAYIELGLRYEANGDNIAAEKSLLEAFAIDDTYLPRWSLANFYLRRDNQPAFWTWAKRAVEMPADEIGPLFELCWRVTPDPQTITTAIFNEKPEFLRQYVQFLMKKNQFSAVTAVTPYLVRTGNAETDRGLLLSAINYLVSVNEASAANSLWRQLVDHRWVIADAGTPNNAFFARVPLPVSFDWTLWEYTGLHSWPGASGLEVEFNGQEPEECAIAEQTVILSPANYTLTYSYSTTDIPANTGIQWQVVDAKSGAVLAISPSLSSDTPKQSVLAFSVLQPASQLRLRLIYKRFLGTPRISGTLVVTSTNIRFTTSS
jgi:tetratricopeptide (TPR) repeat protein